jgi:small-conductance mechanosensitive channel
MPEFDQFIAMLRGGLQALGGEVAGVWVAIQLAQVGLAALIGWGTATLARRHVDLAALTRGWPSHLRGAAFVIARDFGIIVGILVLLLIRAIMMALDAEPSRFYFITVAAKLATAWVVITILASLIRNLFVYRVVAVTAWTVAALSIMGLLERVGVGLDATAIVIGGLRISALLVIETVVLLLVALWVALTASNFFDRRLRTYRDLSLSYQVLLGKLIRFALVTLAVIIVLASVGIDLSSLALFTGALGVGVGFGLQRIVSNLVCGFILLAEKSIKPGDVIAVGDHLGIVDRMMARYTSVVGRDGREYLVPNEDFVTQRVVNLSYSNNRVRLELKFGVSYGSDPHVVGQLAVEAARSVARVLQAPQPSCLLLAFGDSSLDFTLRFWIEDPVEGTAVVRGSVMLALWDIFKREGIEFAYPVRDLRVGEPLRVIMEDKMQGGAP